MERVRQVLPVLFATAGAAAVAYGGYGAGISQAAGAGWMQWLEVAGLLSAGVISLAAAMVFLRRATDISGSFAAEIASLERLVPTVSRHPDGVTALQDLIEVIFEAHLKQRAPNTTETPAEPRPQGGRDHA